jgi:hypothetical protein
MGEERRFGRKRRLATVLATAAILLGVGAAVTTVVTAGAQEEEQPRLRIKGRIQGGENLLNPVWEEAKDPNNRRYTFRRPSTTVSQQAKRLTAYLPKELAIAVLGEGGKGSSTPVVIHVSGGRTTPVTVVIPPGQNVQLVNDDPFPHRIYTVSEGQGMLAPEEMKMAQQRTWQPPGPGVYELRDKLAPSVRSWVVVEPSVVATGYPDLKNEFVVEGIAPGLYKLQAYFGGKPTGDPLNIEVKPFGDLQPIGPPLVVAKGGKSEDAKDDVETEGAKDDAPSVE